MLAENVMHRLFKTDFALSSSLLAHVDWLYIGPST